VTVTADSDPVRTFEVDGPVRYQGVDALLAPVDVQVGAGTFKPKNERDEWVGDHLVLIGLAKETSTAKKGTE
jgi:hypothetical protein